ncbi:MAG: DUF3783 domain-containing protein [Ruminococcus sp.]|nr:DUF3783 domain-containing protein [Ruminococcus sp.]
MEKILLFPGKRSDNEIAFIAKTAQKLRLRFTEITNFDENQTLGMLSGFQQTSKFSHSTLDAPESADIPDAGILLLCNCKDSHIDKLLTSLRCAGLQSIYKAVLTSTNIHWRVGQLSYELQSEREKLK